MAVEDIHPTRPSSSAVRAQATVTVGKTQQEVLADLGLWEGWGRYHSSIPLGPGEELELPPAEDPDPDTVGFAYPLPPVEFNLRNERKFPPPTEEDTFREIFKMLHYTLKENIFSRSYILSVIYNHINSNKRDSPTWQRGFLKANGAKMLLEFWRSPEPAAKDDDFTDRYWVIAITGRMMGTCLESRSRLLKDGLLDCILKGTKDPDEDIRECAVCSLKGLIQHPEGREVVTYSTLLDCLGAAGSL
ncbi:unnamed protein product [Polarella glacialis]|uniref:Uncharacterized protein n=1 Tax=Polarella glacialis TaxID=89957 RepID=A0A813JAE9_POLGL|nr:unnamed protein product [Polarella glacialis]